MPVVSYDGLLTDGKIDAFVSFDNTKVGEMQGKYLADHLKPGSTVALINGDQSIAPGRSSAPARTRRSTRCSRPASSSWDTRPTRSSSTPRRRER